MRPWFKGAVVTSALAAAATAQAQQPIPPGDILSPVPASGNPLPADGPVASPPSMSPTPGGPAAPPPPPPPPPLISPSLTPSGAADTWGGFYVGGNAGFGFDDSDYSISPAGCFVTGSCALVKNNPGRTFSGAFTGSDFVGGGQVGYNYPVVHMFILGAEADFQYDGLSKSFSTSSALSAPLTGSNTRSISQSLDFLGTVRGRVGWVPASEWLIFATGGLAYGDVKSTTTTSFSAVGDAYAGSVSGLKTGWTAGGGVEWAVDPFWSIKAEYLFVDLGGETYTDAITDATAVGAVGLNPQPAYRTHITNQQHIFRIAVNYHFGAPPPVPPAPLAVAAPAPPPAAPKVFIIFFDWDRDAITPEGQRVIQQAADAYRAGAPVQLQITGYTDRSGSAGYNQRLSERRANNVAKALAALGVPPAEMVVSGRGENDNRVPTAPGVREPQNRRVEIVSP